MTPHTNHARKVLLLLVALCLLTVALGGSRPVMAWDCGPMYCPWDPPMHWNPRTCQCECDCQDGWGNCGPCV